MRLYSLSRLACALAVTFSATNCSHIEPDPGSPQSGSARAAAGADITITVTFNTTPSSPSATFADLKYNKSIGFIPVKDDGGIGDFNVVYPFVVGGTAGDGTSYPGLTYSDGAGKRVKWHYTFAWNANDTHNGTNNTVTSWAQARTMFASGAIDFSNHSLTHAAYFSRYYDLKQNEINLFNQIGIKTRTFTIPTDYEGFVEPSFALGYILTASQGYGPNGYASDDNNGPVDYNVLWGERVKSNETRRLITTRRWFGDYWTSTELANSKKWVDDAFNASTGTSADTKFVYQGFSHGLNYPYNEASQFTNYKAFLQYIQNHSKNNDRAWIPGLQEFAEYMEVKNGVVKSQSVSGNVMTISLDYSKLSQDLMWRDVSLLVGGGSIKSVSVSGADNFSFNTSTGLVNIYKKKTSGFSNPSYETTPPQLTSVVKSTSNTRVINLTFDKSVILSSTAGWQITTGGKNNPVTSLTGSGRYWQLMGYYGNVTGQKTTIDYRIQRGTAKDASNGKKVPTYIGYVLGNN
ncbi:polysaccharide deacetylase family protein [Spirosoma aerophilum]